MYIKKLAITLSAASICFISLSNMANASTIPAGFYVGGNVGGANLMTKESHTVNPESHQLGSIRGVVGALLGYDYAINCWARLAAEGFVELTDLSTELSHSSNTYKMNEDYNLGIRLLPEYVFTPSTVGHVILGYVNGRFHINDNGVYGTINSTYHQGGFQTGVGFATDVQNNMLLRFDVLYDFYGSSTKTGSGLTTPTQAYTNRFSQLGAEVGVVYKFG